MATTQTLTRPASLNEYLNRSKETLGPVWSESTQHGLTYQPQADDLFISPYDKCGTTWLQQIVHSLRTRGDMDFENLMQVMPWLELAHWLGLDLYAPQPGDFQTFKSHLNYHQIPKGGRYIVSFRDPKDALVSFYNFLNGHNWQKDAVSLSEFAKAIYLVYQGDRWERSYWGHLHSWWEQRHNPQVLLLCYENMKADLPGTIRTISQFLNIELDQALLALVVEQTSLEYMLAHKAKFTETMVETAMAKIGFTPRSNRLVKVKTGRVGDHRTELPAEIGAEMDAIWHKTIEARTGLASYQALRAALS